MKKKSIKVLILILFVLGIFLVTFRDDKSSFVRSEGKEKFADCIPVITFHRIVPDDVKKTKYPKNQWVGSADVFDQMMKYLYDNNYTTISTEEFYEWYIGRRQYPKKTVLITFDDGFYEDYYIVLPILKKYNFKATSFVVGSRIKELTRPYDKNVTAYLGLDVINKVREEYPNFEFQSHSYDMHYYTKNKKHRIRSMDKSALIADVKMNSQYNFTTMAYPYGDYNKKIEAVLKDAGYLVAFRFSPADYATRESDQFAIPRIKINGYATLNTLKKWLDY